MEPKEGELPLGEEMFGEEPVQQEAKEQQEEKKYADIPEDHPALVALKQQVETVKSEYGGNLSGQRAKIEKLEAQLEALKKGGGEGGAEGEEDVLYKKEEIKWSKDLTQEQRDEMTETEIKQMDEIARMKENQNKVYAAQMKGEKGKVEEKQSDLNGWVRATAKELAGDDVDMANQIIEATKMLNLEGLDESTVKERVGMAAKLVPNYKAPKEQEGKKGKPVSGTDKKEDLFGVDAIVESVHSSRAAGSYPL